MKVLKSAHTMYKEANLVSYHDEVPCGSAIFRIELLLAVRSSPLSCTVSLSCALKDNGSVLSVTSSCCGLSEILMAPLS